MSYESPQRSILPSIPRGRHPFLKIDGKHLVFLPRINGSGADPALNAVFDSSNFTLDGRLGTLLRSAEFNRYLVPLFASEGPCGRTTEEIWRWAAIRLGLYRWRNMDAADLDWFEAILHELDFLVRHGVGDDRRWFYDGF